MIADRTIILGTDWWTDCDDVTAVRMACRFAKRGVWRIAGLILNACMTYSAASLDGFLRFEGVEAPIGIDLAADDFGRHPPYQKRMAETLGSTLTNQACENGVRLYRRLLAEAPDRSVELIEIGYLQVLADLLDSQPDQYSPFSGSELLEQKVKMLWVMGGNWAKDGTGLENNFCRNKRAVEGASRLLKKYPGKICFLGFETGVSVVTRPMPDDSDPLWRAFDDHGSPNGRSSWDPMLILAAADCPDHDAGTFAYAGYTLRTGRADVCPETGENRFYPDPKGRHAYLMKTQKDEWYANRINKMIE